MFKVCGAFTPLVSFFLPGESDAIWTGVPRDTIRWNDECKCGSHFTAEETVARFPYNCNLTQQQETKPQILKFYEHLETDVDMWYPTVILAWKDGQNKWTERKPQSGRMLLFSLMCFWNLPEWKHDQQWSLPVSPRDCETKTEVKNSMVLKMYQYAIILSFLWYMYICVYISKTLPLRCMKISISTGSHRYSRV